MVTFISLFLWLMTGVHPVKVAVDPGVAAVEILLDGQSIGVATAPQWEVPCDFGSRLLPHELVAVARDEDGRELGRAVQLVNLPRKDAEVEIVFEDGTGDGPGHLRVITETTERVQPLAIFVTFDGLVILEDEEGRFPLPAYDPRRIHIVSAEAHFPEGVTARRDITFGGTYGSRVATELTAVPVILEKGHGLRADDLRGMLRVDGRPVTVAAIEEGGGRVFMVRDHGAWPTLRLAGRSMDMRDRRRRGLSTGELSRVLQESRGDREIPPHKDRFYLVIPNPSFSRGLALFPILQPFDVKRLGLSWLATHTNSSKAVAHGQRVAEAVAVAGLRAAADGCPRVVVLVISEELVDVSSYRPDSVRDYLKALRVPMVVWSTDPKKPQGSWGTPETADGLSAIEKASRRLLGGLGKQRIVWVEGNHLPHEIELSKNELGITLAE